MHTDQIKEKVDILLSPNAHGQYKGKIDIPYSLRYRLKKTYCNHFLYIDKIQVHLYN